MVVGHHGRIRWDVIGRGAKKEERRSEGIDVGCCVWEEFLAGLKESGSWGDGGCGN